MIARGRQAEENSRCRRESAAPAVGAFAAGRGAGGDHQAPAQATHGITTSQSDRKLVIYNDNVIGRCYPRDACTTSCNFNRPKASASCTNMRLLL